MSSTTDRILGLLRSIAGALLNPAKTAPPRTRSGSKSPRRTPSKSRPAAGQSPSRRSPAPGPTSGPTSGLRRSYPGDFTGTSRVTYAPKPDGAPDPGEIVWTWVPYEEDHSQGKDRPVLIVGRSGKYLLALMLTSQDHSSDRRGDNDYVDIGTGAWDRQRRPSEVKLDRVLQVSAADLRREGAVLAAEPFAAVAAGLRRRHGWK